MNSVSMYLWQNLPHPASISLKWGERPGAGCPAERSCWRRLWRASPASPGCGSLSAGRAGPHGAWARGAAVLSSLVPPYEENHFWLNTFETTQLHYSDVYFYVLLLYCWGFFFLCEDIRVSGQFQFRTKCVVESMVKSVLCKKSKDFILYKKWQLLR